jgi:hypothetical protein
MKAQTAAVAAAAVTLAVTVGGIAALTAVYRAGNALAPRLGSLVVGMFAAVLAALWVLLP